MTNFIFTEIEPGITHHITLVSEQQHLRFLYDDLYDIILHYLGTTVFDVTLVPYNEIRNINISTNYEPPTLP